MFADRSLGQFSAALVKAGIVFSAFGLSIAAYAGEAATADQGDEALEEVVVTGTLIRGIAPTGSNVISVTSADVAASGATTTSQLLANVPQIGGDFFNGLPQIPTASGTQLQVIRPNLRNTPSGNTSTGAATLILVDGHRMPGVGVNQSVPDPEAVPPGAIERVEIITDGGSSTYGSDAIGGVINYITRRQYNGVEASARKGWADNYNTYDANLTAGTALGQGSIYAALNYAKHDAVFGRDRSYATNTDFSTGLPASRQCDHANASVGTVFAAGSTFCDTAKDANLFPAGQQHSIFVGFSQDFASTVKLDARAFYTNRQSTQVDGPFRVAVNIPSTAFYYQPLPAPNNTATQSVQFSYGPAFGNDSAQTLNKFEEYGLTPTITWDMTSNWQLRGMANFGEGKSSFRGTALNPTLATTYLTSATQATALNAYNIGASNPALLANIANWEVTGESKDKITNLRAIVDGSLFSLPGGKLRVAFGAEYLKDEFSSRTNGTGGGALGGLSSIPFNEYSRNIRSGFGELQVPIVGPANAIPGIHAIDLSIATRYDKYSDFGNTTNPKYGLAYQPVDWVTLRGTWGKSFNAPTAVDEINGKTSNLLVGAFFILRPTDPVPNAATNTSLIAFGADPNLKPQTATNWSVGFEMVPPVLPGLRLSASYYAIDFQGALGRPPTLFGDPVFRLDNFPQYITTNPTLAQIQAFAAKVVDTSLATAYLTANPPLTVYQLIDFRTTNLRNSKIAGIDFAVSYTQPMEFGSIDAHVSGNSQRVNKTQANVGNPFLDGLATGASLVRMSTSLGATIHNFRAQATLNHSSGFNVVRTAALPQDHVAAFDVINLFFRYDVTGQGMWQDLAFTANMNNLLDKDPPAFRTAAGVGAVGGFTNGATLGRLLLVGVSKKF